jgi:hypothetical protein
VRAPGGQQQRFCRDHWREAEQAVIAAERVAVAQRQLAELIRSPPPPVFLGAVHHARVLTLTPPAATLARIAFANFAKVDGRAVL